MLEGDEHAKSLGEHIANQRDKLEMTQEEFATLVHCSPRTVSNWERGSSLPSPDNYLLLQLAMDWETDISEILDGWEPWISSAPMLGLKHPPRAALEAPPGQEKVWLRAQEKKEIYKKKKEEAQRRKKCGRCDT